MQNVRDAAAPRTLNLFLFEPECAQDGPRLLASGRHERHNYNTVSRSVSAQSDAGGSPVSVISVGAVCSASAAAAGAFAGSIAPNESCNDRTHQTIEFFSSRGPTLDGRLKPDISAIDGVGVTAAGSFENPFFGTSAAAPHVAGEAALVLQGASCLISGAAGAADPVSARTNVRNMILAGATAISDAGPGQHVRRRARQCLCVGPEDAAGVLGSADSGRQRQRAWRGQSVAGGARAFQIRISVR